MTAPTDPVSRDIAAMAAELARMRREIDTLKADARSPRLGASSLDGGQSIPITDTDGRVVVVMGRQSDGTYVGGYPVTPQPAPEVPKAPTVVAGFGTLKIASHGSVDPPWPATMAHLNVWMASGATGGTDGGKVAGTIIGTADSILVVSGLEASTWRVWLTAVNTSGSESEPSGVVTGTPTMVVEQDILDGAITELKLADDAVSRAKVALGAIGKFQIGDKEVDLSNLADESVGADQIIAENILARHFGAGSVTTPALAAGSVDAEIIATDTLVARHFTADSVTGRAIIALALVAEHFSANSVGAGAIQAGAVTADKVRAGEVLADISIATGTSGRRILLSGPANEMRFFPALNESAFARLFSYVPTNLPNDVTIELRAINSAQTNVMPRMYLTPDKFFAGLVDAVNADTNRGGRLQLEEDLAAVGISNPDGSEYGMTVFGDGNLQFAGFFQNLRQPRPGDAILAMSLLFTNNSTSTVFAAVVTYAQTMQTLMAPMISVGINGTPTKKQMWTARDENNSLTGFTIRLGLSEVGTAADVVEGGGLPAAASMRVRAWAFRINAEYSATL